jgi:hypothetical protein
MNSPLVLQLLKEGFVGPRQHPIALIGPSSSPPLPLVDITFENPPFVTKFMREPHPKHCNFSSCGVHKLQLQQLGKSTSSSEPLGLITKLARFT